MNIEGMVNYVVSLAVRPPKTRLLGAFFCSFEQFGVDKVFEIFLKFFFLIFFFFAIVVVFSFYYLVWGV